MQIACHICAATYYPPPARRGRGPHRQIRWLARHLAHTHYAKEIIMPRPTAQHTLASYAARTKDRKAAITRIQAAMLPGARALAGTRTPTSPSCIDRQRDLSTTAPFVGRTVLMWQDTLPMYTNTNEPCDGDRITYHTNVMIPDSVGPEVLAELARLAAIYTAEIVRECESITAQQAHALDVEGALYREILA